MDFSYTEEQQMLQDSVQKFVQQNYDFDSRNKIIASESGISEEYWNLFAELGWLTVPFSEDVGGFGGSAIDLIVMMEEFGKANLVEPYLSAAVLSGGLVSELGGEEQKSTMLSALMEGSLQLACAFSESGSRYNLANVSTTARAEGDGWVIEGEKIAVLGAGNAPKHLVVARESGDSLDSAGISVFVVDSNQDTVKMTEYTTVDGRKSANVTYQSARAEARLGDSGTALPALQRVIDRCTVAVAAEAVGALEVLLQRTVEYSKTRKQFGVPIGTFQALQHRMADMFVECQLARSIVVMAAMKLDSAADEQEKSRAVSAAKSRVGKSIRRVGEEAIQIHGGIGMTEELDVGHFFKRVTAIELMFGDSEHHTDRYASL